MNDSERRMRDYRANRLRIEAIERRERIIGKAVWISVIAGCSYALYYSCNTIRDINPRAHYQTNSPYMSVFETNRNEK